MALLIGDIGGTNTRLALTVPHQDPVQIDQFRNSEVSDIVVLLKRYLREKRAVRRYLHVKLAVAAPVTSDIVEFTNSNQTFSKERLRQELGVRSVQFVNDFTAVAHGLPYLLSADRVQIGPGSAVPGAAMAVLGPGTGLGVSGLVPTAKRWAPVTGEGGHCTLAATTAAERDVISRLQSRFNHVSSERILSGPGLLLLYQTLCEMHAWHPQADTPAEVSSMAIAGTDPYTRMALDMFFAFLGNVAGNLALTLGARGGVFLAGGILPRLLNAAIRSELRSRFEQKGRFCDYLANIPLYVVTHVAPALLGLAHMQRA